MDMSSTGFHTCEVGVSLQCFPVAHAFAPFSIGLLGECLLSDSIYMVEIYLFGCCDLPGEGSLQEDCCE